MLSAVIISKNEACNRLLSKPGILFSGQEKINEEPECTESVHEDSEFIFDEPREQKTWFQKKFTVDLEPLIHYTHPCKQILIVLLKCLKRRS